MRVHLSLHARIFHAYLCAFIRFDAHTPMPFDFKVVHRKNSDAESYIHPNLIITPTTERDDPMISTTPNYNKSTSSTGKGERSDHLTWRVGIKKGNSGRKK